VIGGNSVFFLNLMPYFPGVITDIKVQGSNDGGSSWFDVPIGFVAGTQSYPVAAARDFKVTPKTNCGSCLVNVWCTAGSSTTLPADLNDTTPSVSVKYASLPQSGAIKQLGVKGSWVGAPIYYLNLELIKVTDVVIKTAGPGGTWITSPSLNFATTKQNYDVGVPDLGQFIVSVACTPVATCYTGVWNPSGSYLNILPVDLKNGAATGTLTYASLFTSGTIKQLGVIGGDALFYLNLSPVASQVCPTALTDFFLQCGDSDFELSPVQCSSSCITASTQLEVQLVASRPVATDCFDNKNVPVHFNARSVTYFKAAIQTGSSLCGPVNSSGRLSPVLWLLSVALLLMFR
jgi:hypothetical protein